MSTHPDNLPIEPSGVRYETWIYVEEDSREAEVKEIDERGYKKVGGRGHIDFHPGNNRDPEDCTPEKLKEHYKEENGWDVEIRNHEWTFDQEDILDWLDEMIDNLEEQATKTFFGDEVPILDGYKMEFKDVDNIKKAVENLRDMLDPEQPFEDPRCPGCGGDRRDHDGKCPAIEEE